MKHYQVIIIGSGIAALELAIHLPKDMSAIIITKRESSACNTYWAQGGVAVSAGAGDIEQHIQDTLDAGAGLCDEKAVRTMCEHSIEVLQELIDSGMKFDTDSDGKLLYTKEAAHSTARIVHADGDATGKKLHEFLLSKNDHKVYENLQVVDLLIEGDICYGVTVFNGESVQNLYADSVVIASGGVGSLYRFSTNDSSISGDLHGICLEKGLTLQDMEMMQFHPTVYADNSFARKVLLTEALRGEGATVVDKNGRRFLFDYDLRGELAPRDILSRAVISESKKSGSHVYLSFDNFSPEYFHTRFPNIYHNMSGLGFNLPQDRVPIYPAFHYAIGGIKVDLDGKVDGKIGTMQNLYAVGEAASNRVHGANRLASNSLLEGLVFGKIAAKCIEKEGFRPTPKSFEPTSEPIKKDGDSEIKEQLRAIMWENMGVWRKKDELLKATAEIDALLAKNPGRMAKLRLQVGKKMLKSALARPDSLGAHSIKY